MIITQKIADRNLSLDVIRGVAVFGMLLVNFPGNWNFVYVPLHYSAANGSTFADMVYSFFLFTIGASMFYSLSKYNFSWGKKAATKICRRVTVLFAIGLAINLLTMISTPSRHFLVMGDLQYIALAYGLSAVLVLSLKRLRFLVAVVLLFMVAHCFIQFSFLPTETPVPDGILKMLSCISIVLTGYVTMYLSHGRTNQLLLSLGMLIVGLSGLLIGSTWEHVIPASRLSMSSTFVAKVVSYSWMIYGCMIAVIEVCKLTKWTYPFTVFGKNALPVYVLANVLDILIRNVTICNTPSGSPISTLDWFYQHVCVAIFGNNAAASLCYAIIFLLLMWLVALLFYRRKVFIKV